MGVILLEKQLRVIIIEDDITICNNFQRLMDDQSILNLKGITNNSKHAIKLIKDHLPHAVILDLELHAGGGNGLEVLRGIKELQLPMIPYFLVTTNNSSAVTYEMARTLGADFIMYKHEDGYSEKKVVDLLHTMSDIILNNSVTNAIVVETPIQKSKRLTSRIYAQLDLVGISPKVKGYHYLADAIMLVYEGDTYNICDNIGAKHQKTESSVERAMQTAVNRAWRTTEIDVLLKYYTGKISSDKGMPTITEFIHYYANLLKNEY